MTRGQKGTNLFSTINPYRFLRSPLSAPFDPFAEFHGDLIDQPLTAGQLPPLDGVANEWPFATRFMHGPRVLESLPGWSQRGRGGLSSRRPRRRAGHGCSPLGDC